MRSEHMLHNNKGIMFISAVFCVTVLLSVSMLFLARSFYEIKAVEREVDRFRAYASAEAALQGAMSNLAMNSYTGFIPTSSFGPKALMVEDTQFGTAQASVELLNDNLLQINATGQGMYSSRNLSATIGIESIFSKYFVFSEADDFSTGPNAQYGHPLKDEFGATIFDENGRARIAPDDYERALMYFRGNWSINGEGVRLFGNAYVENDLTVESKKSLDVYGDTYVGGAYVNDGTLTIDDTYDDGADQHPMTEQEKEGEFPTLNADFYTLHNSIPDFASSPDTRTFEFEPSADGTHTIVHEYNNRNYGSIINSYDLPPNAIIYVNGDACVRGTIAGKVTVYVSDDIHVQDSLLYNNNTHQADANHSAAFLANDIIYYNNPDMTIEGIFYSGHVSQQAHAQDASRTLDGTLDLGGKNVINVIGNRIVKGNSNMGHYAHRLYLYDPELRKNPPPGLPVSLKIISVVEM